MKRHFTLALLLFCFVNYGQNVGINTTTPKGTLDLHKRAELTFADGIIPPRISGDSLKLKENAYNASHNGAIVYATSPITTSGGAIKTKNVNNKGLYIYDATYVNTGSVLGIWNAVAPDPRDAAYSVRANGNLGLIDLGISLLGSNIRTIPLSNTEVTGYKVDIASANISGNKYTVPSNGIYNIDYSYRVGQGIRAELLGSNRPGIILLKTAKGTTTRQELDSRIFGGLNLLNLAPLTVVNISLTQAQLSHIYRLNAGDVLEFGVVSGGLALGLLTDASAEIAINKIN